ncbi:hypothetical protein BC629DRAFT_1441995 [Irpex lacteus]|nr:hypothetical protein BC629DRAFT_1441995 [Irpex lacteus]
MYMISRGIVTFMIVALIELIVPVATSVYERLWFVTPEFIAGGLYTNVLLAVLKLRKHVRAQLRRVRTQSDIRSIPLYFYHPRENGQNTTMMTRSGDTEPATLPHDGVEVDIYTIQKRDDDPLGMCWRITLEYPPLSSEPQ